MAPKDKLKKPDRKSRSDKSGKPSKPADSVSGSVAGPATESKQSASLPANSEDGENSAEMAVMTVAAPQKDSKSAQNSSQPCKDDAKAVETASNTPDSQTVSQSAAVDVAAEQAPPEPTSESQKQVEVMQDNATERFLAEHPSFIFGTIDTNDDESSAGTGTSAMVLSINAMNLFQHELELSAFDSYHKSAEFQARHAETKHGDPLDDLGFLLKKYTESNADNMKNPTILQLGLVHKISEAENDYGFQIWNSSFSRNDTIVWIFCDGSKSTHSFVDGRYSGVYQRPIHDIGTYADLRLPAPEALVKVQKSPWSTDKLKTKCYIIPDPKVNARLPARNTPNIGNMTLRVRRWGGELYPHWSLDATVDETVLDDSGNKISKEVHTAKARFYIDSINKFPHAQDFKVGEIRRSKDPKHKDEGSITITFLSRQGAATEKCDVTNSEWPNDVRKTLEAMQSLQKPGMVTLELTFHNERSETMVAEMIADFQKSRPLCLFPYFYIKNQTPAIIYRNHKTRADLQDQKYPSTDGEEGQAFQIVKMPREIVFRNMQQHNISLGFANLVEWEYQRGLFETLGMKEHRAIFLARGPNQVIIQVTLATELAVEEIPLDERVVFEISYWPMNKVVSKKPNKVKAVPTELATSMTPRNVITLLALTDNALQFSKILSFDAATAFVHRIKLVAQIEDKQLTEEQLGLRELLEHGKKWHRSILNQNGVNNCNTKAKFVDPASFSNMPGNEIRRLFDDTLSKTELNLGQRQAMQELRHVLDRIATIQAPPGTGKTYTVTAFGAFCLRIGLHVVYVAPSNAAANRLLDASSKHHDLFDDLKEDQRPIMINRVTAETSHLRSQGSETREKFPMNEQQTLTLKTLEEQQVQYLEEIRQLADVKTRRRERMMQQPEQSLTALVVSCIKQDGLVVYTKLPGARRENDAEVDAVPLAKGYLERLTKESYFKWDQSDQKIFDAVFDAITDHVVAQRRCLVLTPASIYSRLMRKFASGTEDHVVMTLDEAAMIAEVKTTMLLSRAPFRNRIEVLIQSGDRFQLPNLVLSKNAYVNEFADQMEMTLLERKVEADGPISKLTENMRLHPAVLDYPNQKKYSGQLSSNPRASARKLPDEYKSYMATYLEEDDHSKINCYMVNITNSRCRKSPMTKSRSNLVNAIELVDLAINIRKQVSVTHFSLSDNVVILVSHMDQARTMNRRFTKAIAEHNATTVRELDHIKRSELPQVSTIDSFQGQDKLIVWWDTTISHGKEKSDVGFLIDDRRPNVACTRALVQLIIFTRSDMVNEDFFAGQKGTYEDPNTGLMLRAEKSFIAGYIEKLVRENLVVQKAPVVKSQDKQDHYAWTGADDGDSDDDNDNDNDGKLDDENDDNHGNDYDGNQQAAAWGETPVNTVWDETQVNTAWDEPQVNTVPSVSNPSWLIRARQADRTGLGDWDDASSTAQTVPDRANTGSTGFHYNPLEGNLTDEQVFRHKKRPTKRGKTVDDTNRVIASDESDGGQDDDGYDQKDSY